MSDRKQISILAALAFLILIGSAANAEATTYWYKIAPNTCTVNVGGDDLSQSTMDSWGTLAISSSASGTVSIHAYCPVLLPQGATINLVRIRTFQSGGLPSYTDVTSSLRRRKWDGSVSTLATADMNPGNYYDDASLSSSVDNENYHYLMDVYVYKSTSASTMPEIEMIEIRYTL